LVLLISSALIDCRISSSLCQFKDEDDGERERERVQERERDIQGVGRLAVDHNAGTVKEGMMELWMFGCEV